MKFAVISDIHLSEKAIDGHHSRRGDLGAKLLKCAIGQLNNEDHPELLLVTGDLLNYTLKNTRLIPGE